MFVDESLRRGSPATRGRRVRGDFIRKVTHKKNSMQRLREETNRCSAQGGGGASDQLFEPVYLKCAV